MSIEPVPRLDASLTLALTRDGGFAALPGLERPRHIECRTLSDHQRERLQQWLDAIPTQRGAALGEGADRRRYRLALISASAAVCWQCELEETQTPSALVGLWKRGPSALDERD